MRPKSVAFGVFAIIFLGVVFGFPIASQISHHHAWWKGLTAGPVYCDDEPGQPCFPGNESEWENNTVAD